MKSLFLIPIREQDTLPVSAIELIKAGDGTETPVKFCEKNSCDDNAAGCTDNICGRGIMVEHVASTVAKSMSMCNFLRVVPVLTYV